MHAATHGADLPVAACLTACTRLPCLLACPACLPQVQACRFIDQRAFGGLTPLHFAVVTGCLEAVQALLRAGASIMVKSGGCWWVGECVGGRVGGWGAGR